MLETERLILRRIHARRFGRADRNALRTKKSSNISAGDACKIRKRLPNECRFYMDCHDKYGFGVCMMIWKETGEIIGWSGLQPLEETGEIEVGYGMKKEFWRRGIGYECAMAWLRYGFENTSAERIVALAAPENTGSWRIMEKCGMRYEKNMMHYGMECVVYAITKNEFLREQQQ